MPRVISLGKMAASTASKSESLGEKTKQKQKKELKKQKNVLFNPFSFKWPSLDRYFEDRVVDELQSLFKTLPVKLPKTPLSYFKGKKLQVPEKTDDCVERKLRSQFVCGIREVTKSLERDNLDLVLVCRSARPAVITRHLIPLAATRSCPALSIREFNKKISPLLGVTSLVALGFKKLSDKSSFKEFVEYARSIAPPLDSVFNDTDFDERTEDKNDEEEKTDFVKSEDTSAANSGKADESVLRNKKSTNDTGFISLSVESSRLEDESKSASQTDIKVVSIKSEMTDKENENQCSISKSDKQLSLVFPLDGPPPFVPKADYSHLYVFKQPEKIGADYIPLGDSKGKKRELPGASSASESDSNEEEISGILGLEEPVAKKPKFMNVGKSKKYRSALIKTQIPNFQKKFKKLKKKK